mgnify:CR=1 FL=1
MLFCLYSFGGVVFCLYSVGVVVFCLYSVGGVMFCFMFCWCSGVLLNILLVVWRFVFMFF